MATMGLLFTVGAMMLAAVALAKAFARSAFTYRTKSPTRILADAKLLSHYVTDIRFRDQAGSSFPGDHGIVLITCAAFMWRFARRPLAWAAILLVILLSAPRIMVGAHWFSDIYFGSLFPVMLISPWILYSPISEGLIGKALNTAARRIDAE